MSFFSSPEELRSLLIDGLSDIRQRLPSRSALPLHASRFNDRNTKKAHYERLGVPSYWLLDPVQPGGLEVYELDEQGRYS